MLQNIQELLYSLVENWGYLGAFIVSILGNMIPFFPIPYLAAIFLTAANFPSIDPTLLGIISGIGGGIGKMFIYFLGRGTSSVVKVSNEKLEALKKIVGNYGAMAAFMLAATPSPDDIIMIPLGMMKYDLMKFFIAVTAGKIVISLFVSWSARLLRILPGFMKDILPWFMGEGDISIAILSVIVLIIASFLIFLIDWMKVLELMNEMGVVKFLKYILFDRGYKEIIVKKIRIKYGDRSRD